MKNSLREKGVLSKGYNPSLQETWEMVETYSPELIEEFQQDANAARGGSF
jgi:hypothetical protein